MILKEYIFNTQKKLSDLSDSISSVFENVARSQFIGGAEVTVTNMITNKAYTFQERTYDLYLDPVTVIKDHIICYFWVPSDISDTLAMRPRTDPLDRESGGFYEKQYRLDITMQDGNSYYSYSSIERPIIIDSIIIRYEEQRLGIEEGGYLELYAKDNLGKGDCYLIRSFIDPQEISLIQPVKESIAYDAAFSPVSESDGLYLIGPLRAIFDDPISDIDGRDSPPNSSMKDTFYLDIQSVTETVYYFYNSIQETRSTGGLFAVPSPPLLSNIFDSKTNQKATDAIGLFTTTMRLKIQLTPEDETIYKIIP